MASKALIVEADHGVTHVLELALKSEGYEVVIARNGVEALKAMRVEQPDLVILDPMLAWLGGARLRQNPRSGPSSSGSPIIVLDPRTDESERIPPVHGGVGDETVTRTFDPKDVLTRIQALRQRAKSAISAAVIRAGVMEIDLERWMVSVEGKPVVLTVKEFGLLRMLLNAKGRVLTRAVLKDVVWERGKVHDFDSRTVDVHIGRLRHKLGPAGAYIVTIRGVGYRLGVIPERRGRSGDAG